MNGGRVSEGSKPLPSVPGRPAGDLVRCTADAMAKAGAFAYASPRLRRGMG